MKNNAANIQKAQDLLAHRALSTAMPEEGRLDAVVETAHLLDLVRELHTSRWGYLMGITGLDLGLQSGKMEVLYHFARGATVLTLRVPVEREHASVPSICSILPPASLYEREIIEMFGITVENTPNADRLFISDDWPQGVYPLRKDFVVPVAQPGPEGKG
jgi:NADH:ubiquinone oxidoreductase subunit C